MWIVDKDIAQEVKFVESDTLDGIQARLHFNEGERDHLWITLSVKDYPPAVFDKPVRAEILLDPDSALAFAERLAQMAKRARNSLNQ